LSQRKALGEDAATGVPRRFRAQLRARTSGFARGRVGPAHVPLLVLAGVVVAITVVVGRLAVRNHHVFIDEALAIFFGRDIAHDPSLAYSHDLDRGPERLTSLVTALIATTTESAHRQLSLLHAFMALCQGLVAVPTWLAGRQLGLGRWAAVVAAAIAASGSFAVYGIFTLNQSIGLLCATAMLWAMVRTLRRPGVASDLAVLATLSATVLARIGWAPLVVALVPGTLAAAWFDRSVGEQLGGWVRALPVRLVRRHPVLLPVFTLGLLAAIAVGPAALLGGEQYGGVRLEPNLQLATLWDNERTLFSHLAIGLALVPFILAVPVLVRDLARPADPTSGGFAWLVLGLLAIFSYAYYGSMNEDRYLAVLVPPFALAGALAAFRRPPPVWAVLVSGVLSARLVVTSYAWPESGPFDFFVAPTSMFFQRVVVGELTALLPPSTPHVPTLALLAALGAALVVAVVARMPGRRRRLAAVAGAIVLTGVLVFQVLAMDYPARRFVDTLGMPDVPADALSFVDRAADGGRVEPLAVDDAVHPDLNVQLWFLRVYNRTLGAGMAVMRGPPPPGAPPPRVPTVHLDWHTGDAAINGAVPHMLLQKPGFNAVGFSGTTLPAPPYFPFAQLQRLRRPLEALWIVRGDDVEGYPKRGHALRLRIFPPTDRGACVEGSVAVHPLADRGSRYRITGAVPTLRGTGEPGQPEPFVARVRGGDPTTLVLRSAPVRLPDGSWLGATFVDLQATACD
jgi:hypothetical protein